ncbi:MAG: hypothetical protein DRI95_16115 [Bacteroidetes bacterium]|nr:MAG: hypothetical protein DRI95_16115 [Bacteroidota bacterium]
MSKKQVKIILEKINKKKITWWDISEIEKLGVKIPTELEIIADENILYDEDNLPITDEDIRSGKIKAIKNTAKIDMINYLWLIETMPGSMNISEKVNKIIELYREIYLNTQKAMNIKLSKTKSETIV